MSLPTVLDHLQLAQNPHAKLEVIHTCLIYVGLPMCLLYSAWSPAACIESYRYIYTLYNRSNEQALVSLKLKKPIDAGVGRTFAVIIEGS